MKKELNDLLKAENDYLDINCFCTLHRWTKIHFSTETYDGLEAQFCIGERAARLVSIKARDWQGIVDELQVAQSRIFSELAEQLNSELKHGRLSS